MKKHLIFLIVIICCLSILFGCSDGGTVINDTFYERGLTIADAIFSDFLVPNVNRFMSYVPEYISGDIDSDLSGTAALWGYGAVMTMTATQLKINPDDKNLQKRADFLVDNLEQYRYPRKGRIYSATVGKSEPYYDDNAWVALAMHDLADTLENDEYKEIAKGITDYVLSGESPDGGIFWKETVSSRNTCSCGPTIIAALRQYNRSGGQNYLDAAKRIYEWTSSTLRDPADNVYWDNAELVDGKEVIAESKFTYNSGTMITAGVMLYQITGEEQYLEDARNTAEGAHFYFTSTHPSGIKYYPSTPWFNLYLLQGFLSLYEIDKDPQYLESFETNLERAWEKGRDENGYVQPSWGCGPVLDEYKYVSLLQESATAECYALIGGWRLNSGK